MLLCDFVVHPGAAFIEVPPAEIIINRERFIYERCAGKRVVNFGSNEGELHANIKKVAAYVFGVDKEGEPDLQVNLDEDGYLLLPIADIYLCGEVIEHLSNPGNFLRRLRRVMQSGELIITTPNAFAESAQEHMRRGIEHINPDHVAWYSYHTLKNLLERAGFKVKEFYYFGPGRWGFNDGLIFVAR